MGVTKAQLKKIWATAKELGLDEESLRDVVEQVSKSRSISSLSIDQANKVIDRIANMTVAGMATKKQIWLIGKLEEELGWEDNPKRLQAFMKKYAGVDRIEWLTSAKAWRIIESLKKVKERNLKSS
ncbi:phage protein GemA/Gp16 family protein [Bacillus sp. CGMCC 1.16541]|uniref:phage protein GemA/Gp16 family protein n=1 Tax=Bacillus sp. CGMCC 1.16541 TaxID=2185143 RepID=UPI000D73F6C0|nr:phage protein GemA/Gp16 family protein [Bacillus sp. CGMCC 1.16541]